MEIEADQDGQMHWKFPQMVAASSDNHPRIERSSPGPSLATAVQWGFVFL